MYRKITGKTGVKYWKDGKFIKKTDIPASVFQNLQTNPEYDDSKECIFCGQPGTKIRQLNLMIVNLCDIHYFEKRLGQIAEHLNNLKEKPDGNEPTILEGQQAQSKQPKVTSS